MEFFFVRAPIDGRKYVGNQGYSPYEWSYNFTHKWWQDPLCGFWNNQTINQHLKVLSLKFSRGLAGCLHAGVYPIIWVYSPKKGQGPSQSGLVDAPFILESTYFLEVSCFSFEKGVGICWFLGKSVFKNCRWCNFWKSICFPWWFRTTSNCPWSFILFEFGFFSMACI